jgi:ABC-type multidrug transport system fused ATPase/permease subunit
MTVLQPWPLKLILDTVVEDQLPPPLVSRAVASMGELLHVSTSPKIASLLLLCISLFLIHALLGILKVLHTYVLGSAGLRMVFKLRCDVFHHLQRLSLGFHRTASVGDSIYRVTSDTNCVNLAFNHGLVPAVGAAVTLGGIAFILLTRDSAVSLSAFAMSVPLLFIIAGFDRIITNKALKVSELESEVSARVQETLEGIPAVQAFCREDTEYKRFRRRAGASLQAKLNLNLLQSISQVIIDLFLAGGIAAIVWFAASRVLQGRMTAGDVVLVVSYIWMLYEPLLDLSYTAAYGQIAAGEARRVFDVLDTRAEIVDTPGSVDLARRAAGGIVFEGVSFRYREKLPVLTNVSLEIPAGSSVAIVGPSGAGKTTLAGLVPRFYDPVSGRITLDGRDLRSLTLESLRRNVALVLQEPILFDATIRENIAYGRPHATSKEILEAANLAGAREFIECLPKQFDTRVGRQGMILSGGQRQRVAIARAFLKDAPVLILDEPTSVLDSENEMLLLEELEKLAKGRTTIVIAHRLSTARWADRIVVMMDGRLVEYGTHNELVRQGGFYTRIQGFQAGIPGMDRGLSPGAIIG